MGKIQIRGVCRREFLFVLILFFLSGCLTTPKPQVRKGVLDNVLVFRDLQEVDLDNDGVKEILAIYSTATNSTGVKVIKSHNDKGDIIFERVFNTPDVKFARKKNTLIIIAEESVQLAPGCTRCRIKNVYRWDGKAFTLAGKR